MSRSYENTIDWNQHWRNKGENKAMIVASSKMARRIGYFIDRFSIQNMADFGCGSARTLFILAGKYPNLGFYGFDSAMSIIKRNRAKVERYKLGNITFEAEVLPNIKTKMKFDLVFCIATLHYVKNIRKAVLELYDRVADDGLLIFNYPNRNSLYWYRSHTREKDFDQNKRFSLVINGINLLTLREIESLLNRKAKNFWDAVGEKSDRANMAVIIRK